MMVVMMAYIAQVCASGSDTCKVYDKIADETQKAIQEQEEMQSIAHKVQKTDRVRVLDIGDPDIYYSYATIPICATHCTHNDSKAGLTREEWKRDIDRVMDTICRSPEIEVVVKTANDKVLTIADIDANTAQGVQRNRANIQNECSIAEVIQYIAEYIAEQVDVNKRLIIAFDYIYVYYCNMPAVVDMLKSTLKNRTVVIQYKSAWNIVYDAQQNMVYNADCDTAKYVHKLYTEGNRRYTIVRRVDRCERQATATWSYTYIQKDADDANVQTYALNNIDIYGEMSQRIVQPQDTKDREANRIAKLLHSIFSYNMADICDMVRVDGESVRMIALDIHHRYRPNCEYITMQIDRMVVNMNVLSNKNMQVKQIRIKTAGVKSLVLQIKNDTDASIEVKKTQPLTSLAAAAMQHRDIHMPKKLCIQTLSIIECEYPKNDTNCLHIQRSDNVQIQELELLHANPQLHFDAAEIGTNKVVINKNTLERMQCTDIYDGSLLSLLQQPCFAHIDVIVLQEISIVSYINGAVEIADVKQKDVVDELVELSDIVRDVINNMILTQYYIEVDITITRDKMMARIEQSENTCCFM